MTVSGIGDIPSDLGRLSPTAIGRSTQNLNDVNHETKTCATPATHLDVAKDANASITLSDQPHFWHISAKSKEEDFGNLVWPENDFRHIPRTKDALYGVLWKTSSGSSVVMTCWTI